MSAINFSNRIGRMVVSLLQDIMVATQEKLKGSQGILGMVECRVIMRQVSCNAIQTIVR